MENDTNTYTFTFYHDPGHGWLAAPHSLLAELQVEISSYSYMDGEYVYLEEDEDAARFIRALREQYPGVEVKEVSEYHPGRSWIRNLPGYQPPRGNDSE
jgi:hypothetical protein